MWLCHAAQSNQAELSLLFLNLACPSSYALDILLSVHTISAAHSAVASVRSVSVTFGCVGDCCWKRGNNIFCTSYVRDYACGRFDFQAHRFICGILLPYFYYLCR